MTNRQKKDKTGCADQARGDAADPWLANALAMRWLVYREELRACAKKPTERSVHELRVATRRLISQFIVLKGVCPGRRPQRAIAVLKRQLQLLGTLRDTHVQRAFLDQHLAQFPELWPLLRPLKQKERALIKATARRVRKFRTKKLEKWLLGLLLDLAPHSANARKQERLDRLGWRCAEKAFAQTVACRRLIDASDLKTVHRTRVAFKKFRYIAESLPPRLTGMRSGDLRDLAGYQRKMGKIQDLQVIDKGIRNLAQAHNLIEEQLAPFFASLDRRRARALRTFLHSADRLSSFWPPAGHPPAPGKKLLHQAI